MLKKDLFFFLICSFSLSSSLSSSLAYGQSASYYLSMPKPQNHYFEVQLILRDLKEKEVLLKMPVWAPGSYLVREFSKNVNQVIATDEQGKRIPVKKVSKNGWSITRGKAKEIKIKYEVYAFELSVRTSFLDLTHGFISGSGVFMYTESTRNNKGILNITPHPSFKKITTALTRRPIGEVSESFEYTFENYDELADCPIEIGNQETFDFLASGVKHTVGIYGSGNYEIEKLKKDMAKVIESTTKVFGQNPNKEYTFIIHNVVNGQGGLEHTNSTTLSVNRWTYQGDDYLGFLNLVAHEYFHLWNVKRLRPIELGPFNYDQENYTSLLWVMEGFTSYYDELILLRAGYYDQNDYLNKLQSSINYVEGSIGSRIQPVAHASFDAWIKAYRPSENSANTTMTYYSRGANIAAMLDAMIIHEYKGEKCLDHFMQMLYDKYYVKLDRGFTEKEFETDLAAFLRRDMKSFFDNYINGTEIPDFDTIFSKIGMNVKKSSAPAPSFGASFSQSSGKLIVKNVRSNSAAENAGLSVNDEIIGCNGYRVDQTAFDKVISTLDAGEKINMLISRDDVLLEIMVEMTNFEKVKFTFAASASNATLLNYWLRND